MNEQYEISHGQVPVSQQGIDARSAFITRTYNHLMGAIVGFTLFEVWLFTSGLAEQIAVALMSTNWLLILGGFMIVTWFATRTAHTSAIRRLASPVEVRSLVSFPSFASSGIV